MAAHSIAAIFLCKFNGLIRFAQCRTGRIRGHDAGKTATHRQVAYLREVVPRDPAAEAFKRRKHQRLIGTMHQNGKVLTAKTIKVVISAEGVVENSRYQQDDFLTHGVPKLVIDRGKVVDAHGAEPIVGRHPMASLCVGS